MQTIGLLLRTARKRSNMSKSAAARALNVTRPTYDAWEDDHRLPRGRDHAVRIARFVGKPTWVILDLAGALDAETASILREHTPGPRKRAGQRRGTGVVPVARMAS